MIVFKASDTKRLTEAFGSKHVLSVSRSALRDTGQKTRVEISKQIRKEFNVSAGEVRDRSYVTRDRGNVSDVAIGYRDFRPNLGRFATRAQKNVRVKVKKNRGTRLVRGGFRIPRFGSLIWQRLSPAEAALPRFSNRRVKIKVLRTISVPEMVRYRSNTAVIQHTVQDTFNKRFDHHFRRRLGLR